MGHYLDLKLRHSTRWAFDRADGTGVIKEVCEACDVNRMQVDFFLIAPR
jgi:hypothetical protein